MNQIERARQRLEEATGLAQFLDASWMAFDLVVAACEQGQDGRHELFPAFAFAAAAAAEGRALIAFAPSLPSGPVPAERCDHAQTGMEETADAVADLADALHLRLAQASERVGEGPDAAACAQAAVRAAQVHKLLAEQR